MGLHNPILVKHLHSHAIQSPIKQCTVIRKNCVLCKLCDIRHYILGTGRVNQFIDFGE